MITWWDCPTFVILVFRVSCFNSLDSLMDLVQHTAIPHPPGRTTLVIIFILFFPLSILVNSLITSPGSCDQDALIPVFPIHDFSECVTGIFSLVTGDDVIGDSSLLDRKSLPKERLPSFLRLHQKYQYQNPYISEEGS